MLRLGLAHAGRKEVAMAEERVPANAAPVDVYKAIIDECVDKTNNYGYHRFVAEFGFFSKAPSDRKFNEFIESLASDQTALLAEMLREERLSAIHDILAALSWWVTCQDVGLTYRGEPMPVALEGGGLHHDYIGRLDGWEWPDQPA
jgi:hypothetical protein